MRGATSTPSRGIREWLALVEDAARDVQAALFDTRVASLKALPGSAAAAAARAWGRAFLVEPLLAPVA